MNTRAEPLRVHEAALVAFGRFMVTADPRYPSSVDYAEMGRLAAEAINGIPAVRAAIEADEVRQRIVDAARRFVSMREALGKVTPGVYLDLRASLDAKPPVRDPLSPQWEDCKVCGGDHWTKDHPPETQFAWLIERGQPERQVPTVWWTGTDWTTDAHAAEKYATRDIAERVIVARSPIPSHRPPGSLSLPRFGRSVEHGFHSASPDSEPGAGTRCTCGEARRVTGGDHFRDCLFYPRTPK